MLHDIITTVFLILKIYYTQKQIIFKISELRHLMQSSINITVSKTQTHIVMNLQKWKNVYLQKWKNDNKMQDIEQYYNMMLFTNVFRKTEAT